MGGYEGSENPELKTTVMFNGYRTISQHLNDLKKENFSLKLRIYFLEERFQQKFEDSSSEDVHRRVSGLKRWKPIRFCNKL